MRVLPHHHIFPQNFEMFSKMLPIRKVALQLLLPKSDSFIQSTSKQVHSINIIDNLVMYRRTCNFIGYKILSIEYNHKYTNTYNDAKVGDSYQRLNMLTATSNVTLKINLDKYLQKNAKILPTPPTRKGNDKRITK